MKVLVIYGHPKTDSYNHALLEAFLEGVEEQGHEYEVIDLYREKFDPVLEDPHPRAPVKEDAQRYQKKVKEADWLAFIFPTFWYRAPAMVEGFIDRVFRARFAYKYVPFVGSFKVPKGLLPCKKMVVIQTFGGPAWYYWFIFHRIPWKRFKAVMKFCGIRKFIYQPCYYVPFGTDKRRKKYLKKVRAIGARLKSSGGA